MTTPAPRRCRSCDRRLRAPSPDGYGPVCRRAVLGPTQMPTPAPQALTAPSAGLGQLTLEDAMYPTLLTTPGMASFAESVDAERQRQIAKFGDQHHRDGTAIPGDAGRADCARRSCQTMAERGDLTWRDILWEEVAEAVAEADPTRLRAELVQVAAVCAAWVSDLDRRDAGADA